MPLPKDFDPTYYEDLQKQMAARVIREDELGAVGLVAGVDVAYQKGGEKVIAAITVLDATSLALLETAIHEEEVSFPYVPGLFSFREIPPVLGAWEKLQQKPDLLVCDGQGYAHPRRFGLACHLGLELDLPTIGCGKTRLLGTYEEPEQEKGCHSALLDGEECIGAVLRTQESIKPVFVSVGHRVSLPTATDWVLRLCTEYRLPETTRTADQAVRLAMKAAE